MSERGPLRFGAVGVGGFFRGTIAPAMKREPLCDLVAVVSRHHARAEKVAAEFPGARPYADYSAMLADPAVEAVYIATPNALHASQVVQAAQAGKHIFCEKPLAIDPSGAADAVAACAGAGVHLGIDFHNRYLPWVGDVRRMIEEGRIGDVEVIELDVGSGPRHYDNWRADPALAGLGTVHNVGVHAFDFLRVLLRSEPETVMAVFDTTPAAASVEMLALVTLRFANGTVVHCNCNERLHHPRNTIVLYGTAGRIVGSGLTRSRQAGDLAVLTEEGETSTQYPLSDAHHRCLAAFARAVIDDRAPDPSGVDGLRSAQLCEAISRSAREGRIVDVVYGATASFM